MGGLSGEATLMMVSHMNTQIHQTHVILWQLLCAQLQLHICVVCAIYVCRTSTHHASIG